MFVDECLGINSSGNLTIGGLDTVKIAKEFGTPAYVLDENRIRDNCRAYVSSIEEDYGGKGITLYASKALCCKEICKIAAEEKLGLDVVSGGEIFTALSAGFPTERIYFHGNNKTLAELEYAIENDIGRIMVDNLFELENIDALAKEKGKKVNVILRVKPGIDAHTHSFIRTGQIDSKFGLALETGEAMAAVKIALKTENIVLKGIHCHIGSQIFDVDPFMLAAEVMIDFMAQVLEETGTELQELDLGGGFGIKYLNSDKPLAYDEYMRRVSVVIKAKCAEKGLKLPFIIIEPGRTIVGSAGITLYTVGAVKTIPDIRTYVSIDGGMGDNPRYILYQSSYEAVCANKASQPKDTVITLAGRCCESGDLIQEDMPLQKVEPGDIVAVLSTGAYNYSMASNYNRICRPPVVFVKDGKARLVVRRESYEDILQNDL